MLPAGRARRPLLVRRAVGVGVRSAVGQVLGPHAGGVLWRTRRQEAPLKSALRPSWFQRFGAEGENTHTDPTRLPGLGPTGVRVQKQVTWAVEEQREDKPVGASTSWTSAQRGLLKHSQGFHAGQQVRRAEGGCMSDPDPCGTDWSRQGKHWTHTPCTHTWGNLRVLPGMLHVQKLQDTF